MANQPDERPQTDLENRLGHATSLQKLMGKYDDQGRLILGNPNEGCYYCGSVTTRVVNDGKVILELVGLSRHRKQELQSCGREVYDTR